jgi:hypothetical protein
VDWTGLIFRARVGMECSIIQWERGLHVDLSDCIQEQIRHTRTDNQQRITTQYFNVTNHNTESDKTEAQTRILTHNTHLIKETIKRFKSALNYSHDHGYTKQGPKIQTFWDVTLSLGKQLPTIMVAPVSSNPRSLLGLPHQHSITFQKT